MERPPGILTESGPQEPDEKDGDDGNDDDDDGDDEKNREDPEMSPEYAAWEQNEKQEKNR